MQNVPNILILHIQEHIAKIVLYLTFITLSYHNPQITIIRFLVYSLQPFICILIQNHACKMLPIYLYCILGTHRKNSLASFFDRLGIFPPSRHSILLIQNYECKMFSIHLYYILGTHRKNSLASFFDHLICHKSEITTFEVLVYFLPAFHLYIERKPHTECSLYT